MRNIEKWREKCYSQVPDHIYRELKTFRMSHPYKTITYDGYDWKYICGGESGDAVLLLTGAMGTGESNWKPIQRHEKQFRVIATSYPPVGSVEKAMEGIISVLDAERIDRVHIIGGSLGAGLGHTLIRHFPDRVNKLVLIAFGFIDDRLVKDYRRWIRLLSAFPWWMIKRIITKSGESSLSVVPADEAAFELAYFKDMLKNDMDKPTLVGHIKIGQNMALNASALRFAEQVDGTDRVLIIQADDDETFTREQRQALIRSYPGATTHLFETGGHLLDFTHGKEIEAMVDQFLTNPS